MCYDAFLCFQITVQAEDLGWEKKTNLIYINIKVIERNISEAVLGFIQPTWW